MRNCPALPYVQHTDRYVQMFKKRNHFAVVCQSKSNDSREYLTEESLLFLDGVEDKRCYSNVFVDGRKVKFLLDCGSTVNLLPSSILPSIGKRTSDLRPPRSSLRMFDRTELRTVGMLTADLTHPRTKAVMSVEFCGDLPHTDTKMREASGSQVEQGERPHNCDLYLQPKTCTGKALSIWLGAITGRYTEDDRNGNDSNNWPQLSDESWDVVEPYE